MRLPDANVLIYAVDAASPRHSVARAWLERVLSGTETVAFAWVVLLAFLRVTTQPAAFAQPLTAEEALAYIHGWLDQPPSVVIHPTGRHAVVLEDLLRPLGTAGNIVPDAHLAALAIEHGAEVCSSDRDFGRFSGVRWSDPLDA